MAETTAQLVHVETLSKAYPISGGLFAPKIAVHALNGVTFDIARGESLGVVGESGCGKTTLALALIRLLEPDSGSIYFNGQDITHLKQKKLRPLRRRMQMIFQDPFASLNPRMPAGEIIEEPLLVHRVGSKKERRQRVAELLDLVGLPGFSSSKYPHEFSGGQRQRIGIARAIALHPDLIIADEPVSALDVSIQGEILNLFRRLRKELNLTYLFISHDLKVIAQVCDRVAVMYLGKIVEMLSADRLFEAKHPYTQALLSAVPIPDPHRRKTRIILPGDVPSTLEVPKGCCFQARCAHREGICFEVEPALASQGPGQKTACHMVHKVPRMRVT